MKKFCKIFFISLGSLLAIVILILSISLLWISVSGNRTAKKYISMAGPEVSTITVDGHTFRDLNKNGKLDKYEDNRLSTDERVINLLSQMTFQFADIARQEYLASGIRLALHPMADLATEPRWGRINGTFGEDAQISAIHTYAYVKGFQGDSLGPQSVACMTKHYSGGGPQKEGIDPHFPNAKGQVYPGDNFDYHLIPFDAAFSANTAEIMPYYGIPTGQTSENVGFGFNKDIITGLLRNKYHFNGVICTDWGLITDIKFFGLMILPARA